MGVWLQGADAAMPIASGMQVCRLLSGLGGEPEYAAT
jgi:hypothetical protein